MALQNWRCDMQKLIKALENMMVAITFAEAGEYDEAKKLTSRDLAEEVSPAADRLATKEA